MNLQEVLERRATRRDFLRVASLSGIGALAVACGFSFNGSDKDGQTTFTARIAQELDFLKTSLEDLNPQQIFPDHPTSQYEDTVRIAKGEVSEPLKEAREAIEDGEVGRARGYLLRIQDFARSFAFTQDPMERTIVSKELKNKHDPLDKYIKDARPSQVWLESLYLPVIDLLVGTDIEYSRFYLSLSTVR